MKRKVLSCVIVLSFAFIGYSQRTQVLTDANGNFRLGLELVEKEQFAAAQRAFETYLQGNPDRLKKIEAEYYIAHCALHLNQPRTQELLSQFKEQYPRHPKSHFVYFELGNYYYQREKYKDAAGYYEKIDFNELKKEERYEARFNLAYSYFASKNFKEARVEFDKIKGFNHNYTYAANYYSGYLNFKEKNYDQALADFKVAEDITLYKNAVPYMLMNIYYAQGKYRELVDYGEEVFKSKRKITSKSQALLLLAQGHFELGDYEQALKAFGPYLDKVKAPDPEVSYRFGYAAWKTGNYDKAIESFKRVISTEDSLGQHASYYLGSAYVEKGNKEYALIAFKDASEAPFDPHVQEEALFNLGKLQYEEKQFAQAIETFESLKKSFPRSSYGRQVDELVADSYLNSEDYSKAIRYIESLPSKNNSIKKTYQVVTYHKGVELFNKRKYTQALALFEKSIDYPTNKEILGKAHFWKGEAHSILGEWEKAYLAYARLFKVPGADKTSEYVRGLYGIGYAYFNSGQYENAQKKFELYVKRVQSYPGKPYLSDALVRLADCYFAQSQYDPAMTSYQEALKAKNAREDYVYYQMGIVKGRASDITGAYANFDKVIADKSSVYRTKAMYQKATLALQNGKYQDAVDGFSFFLDNEPNSDLVPYVLLQRGGANRALGKFEPARKDYDRILANYCTEEYAEFALGAIKDVLLKLNDDTYQERIDAFASCNPDNKNIERIVYNGAQKEYGEGNFAKAISAFQNFLEKYPNSSLQGNALFYLAESHYYEGQNDQALGRYQQVADLGHSANYEEAIIRLGQLHMRLEDHEKAVKYNEEALDLANNPIDQLYRMIDLFQSHYELGNFNEAIQYCDAVLNAQSKVIEGPHLSSLYKGKSLLGKGDSTTGVGVLNALIAEATDVYGAEANVIVAKVLMEQEAFQHCIDTLKFGRKRYPNYIEWIGESFLVSAECYHRMGEDYNAIAVLKSLAKFPVQDVVDRSQTRLAELEALREEASKAEQEVLEIDQDDLKSVGEEVENE